MDTVQDYIGPSKDAYIHSALLGCTKSRAVGIELELENVTGYEVPHNESQYFLISSAPGWAVKRDNSLRNNGIEFISLPSEAHNIETKVLDLFAQPNSKKWKTSSRTGLHVHVNVRDFTWPEIRALVATYCLLEPALFAWVGKEREENIFCVPYYRTPRTVLNFMPLQSNLPMPEAVQQVGTNWCKYTAFHLGPIYKFGSVEFRHAPSWTEPYRVASWAKLCEKIVTYAKGKTPKQVIEAWDSNWAAFVSQFTWVANYYETVQKLDSDFLANTIAGVEVDSSAWNPASAAWEDDWEATLSSKKKAHNVIMPKLDKPPSKVKTQGLTYKVDLDQFTTPPPPAENWGAYDPLLPIAPAKATDFAEVVPQKVEANKHYVPLYQANPYKASLENQVLNSELYHQQQMKKLKSLEQLQKLNKPKKGS